MITVFKRLFFLKSAQSLSKQLSGVTVNTTIASIFTELSSQYFGLSCKPRDVTFLGVYFFYACAKVNPNLHLGNTVPLNVSTPKVIFTSVSLRYPF